MVIVQGMGHRSKNVRGKNDFGGHSVQSPHFVNERREKPETLGISSWFNAQFLSSANKAQNSWFKSIVHFCHIMLPGESFLIIFKCYLLIVLASRKIYGYIFFVF